MKNSKSRFISIGITILFILCYIDAHSIDTLKISSPSGKILVKIWIGKQLSYAISYDNKIIMQPSHIDLQLNHKLSLSANNKIKSYNVKKVNEEIICPVPERRKIIHDVYNQLSVAFSTPYLVDFRVYDDGVAYRISTRFKDSITIKNEVAEFCFPGQPSAYIAQIHKMDGVDIFHSSFEELYILKRLDHFSKDSIAFSPFLVIPQANPKIAITESDLDDYPGMFLRGTDSSQVRGTFAGYPIEEKIAEGLYSSSIVSRRADYIAKTKGSRSFPWRILMIAPADKDLPSNDMVYCLASPSRLKNTSWIKPGNITDEWIVGINLFNVPFKSGLNTASYKYYIDFAWRFGFDRIMMDAGWSDTHNLFHINPDINMDTLVAYAKQKHVKIAMWTLALTLNRQLDSALTQFNKWGVDFIMTDFIQRDDQKSVNFHKRIAEACAANKIMIMYHGTYPPKGFNRTYPNAITREAVLGSEYNIGSDKVSPNHDLLLPFTRMLAGSLDYEPGLLNNASKKDFRPIEGDVMSPGTRSHQLAMLAVFDSPIQFFSGNPSQGYLEPKYMDFLGHIPTTWDQTNILDAKVGQYIVTARKKEGNWFIGGMTNWDSRDLTINFDFLNEGQYQATICEDGVNADRYASDYRLYTVLVNKNNHMSLHLAPGGGFLIKLKKL